MLNASSITWSPLLPEWVIVTLAALAIVTVAYYLVRRVRGTALRILCLTALLLALGNPSLVLEERKPRKDVAVLLVDETASQQIANREAQTKAARSELLAQLNKESDQLEVREVTLRHNNLADSKAGTSLVTALERAVADISPHRLAGAIALTDGQAHDMPSDTSRLKDLRVAGAPVHVLLTGSRDDRDRRLVLVKAPTYGLVGGKVALQVRIDDPKGTEAQAAVTLETPDEVPKRIMLPVGRNIQVEVPVKRRGKTLVSLTVDPVENELITSNNQVVTTINGVRDRLRVLLVSGVPHPGERTWRNLLKADPSVDLVHFTILRPPEKQDGTPIQELSLIAFPTRELFQNKLDEFDLIVFDRYRRRGVLPTLYLRNITDFVRRGGALLEVAGPGFAGPYSLFQTALGEILPGAPTGAVIERGFKPRLTDEGIRHPITARLPGGPVISTDDDIRWGRWFRQVEVTPRAGNVLMTGLNNSPILMVDRVGEGRVAQITSDQLWLWARGYEGGGPYAELIRRLAHWLMKEPELEENDLRASERNGRLHVEMRSLMPVSPEVEVIEPSGQTRNLRLKHIGNGRYQGDMPLTESGLYRVSDGERSALVATGAAAGPELREVVSSEKPLAPLVAESGGSARWLGDGLPTVRLVQASHRMDGPGWIGLRRNNDYDVTGLRMVSLLPAWLSLLVVAMLVLLAWRKESE